MMITHKLSIDLARREELPVIHAVENDSGRAIALLLHANGLPWTFPGTATATVRYRKADGTGGEYDILSDGTPACTAAGNLLTVALAPQMLTCPGNVTVSVLLRDGEEWVQTFRIPMQVHEATDTGSEGSGFYFNLATAEGALNAIGSRIKQEGFSSVILLGDSITDGAGGSGYCGSYSAALSSNSDGYCWANLLKKYLSERFGTTVQNFGMYGTGIALQYQQALELIGKEDLVIWLVGTGERDDPAGYAAALREYAAALKEKCGALLIVSNIPATRTDELSRSVTMQRMDDLTALAARGLVPFFSLYRAFTDYCHMQGIAPEDCFSDHVHPNDTGYLIMFRLLCRALGFSLDPYTQLHSTGSWWTGADSSELILTDNTDTRTEDGCTDGISPSSDIVPCVLMSGYDSDSATTAVSGHHITRVVLNVYEAGQITFGTVDLSIAGYDLPSYISRKEFITDETGMVEFELDLDVGANETLAVQSPEDSGRLGIFVTFGDDADTDLRIFNSAAFAGQEADAGIHLYGTIYGE